MPGKTVVAEKGIEYEVSGEYPEGPYVKTIKNRGPQGQSGNQAEVDVETMTEPEFRRLVLKALGIPVKEV